MSTPAETMSEVRSAQVRTSAAVRPFFWSVRRELWEHRLIYLGPAAAAVVFLFGYLISLINLRVRMHGEGPIDPQKQHLFFNIPHDLAGALIMGTGFIVGLYYCLDALYGERRDRSILFWKSMPVSDLTTVLSKVTIPFAILPLLSFAITVVAQALMLALSSVALLGSGASIETLWSHSTVFHDTATLFYHIVTVHGLWYAPFYAWLLFISAWAPRAPIVWALMPPFVLFGVEKLAFNTDAFFQFVLRRLAGPENAAAAHAKNVMEAMAALGPLEFFTLPGLWVGLGFAAILIAAAVRLRRSRGPV